MKQVFISAITILALVACSTEEPAHTDPPPLPPPSDTVPTVRTVATPSSVDTGTVESKVHEPKTYWEMWDRNEENKIVIWRKETQTLSVRYEDTPDVQKACEQLLATMISRHEPPMKPDAYLTVLISLRTEGVSPGSEWVLEDEASYAGEGPGLTCQVRNNGTAEWEEHLPGLDIVAFGERDSILDGTVHEGWKDMRWLTSGKTSLELALTDWVVAEDHNQARRWIKVVTYPPFRYEETPDGLQACKKLLAELINHHEPPGNEKEHQAFQQELDKLASVQQGTRYEAIMGWHFDGSEDTSGTEPYRLGCVVELENPLPGAEGLIFGIDYSEYTEYTNNELASEDLAAFVWAIVRSFNSE